MTKINARLLQFFHLNNAQSQRVSALWYEKIKRWVGLLGYIFDVIMLLYNPANILFLFFFQVWSGTLGKKIMTLGDKNFSHATATSFSPNGAQVAVGYHDGYVRLYEVSSGAELFALRHHEARVRSLKWCSLPGGKRHILIGYDSGYVEVGCHFEFIGCDLLW